MNILILQLVMGLRKGVSCMINMHAISYQPYNKMHSRFKEIFKK